MGNRAIENLCIMIIMQGRAGGERVGGHKNKVGIPRYNSVQFNLKNFNHPTRGNFVVMAGS